MKESIQIDNKIVVAVSLDENYTIPARVMLYSLMKTLDREYFCDIHVFIPGDFPKKCIQLIESLGKLYGNCALFFHDMSNTFKTAFIAQGHHVTSPAFFRMKLSSLLPNENKCLYFDADIIVNNDISQLYKTDVNGYYIAGVKAAVYHWPPDDSNPHKKRLGIDSVSTYVNTGVALFNLKEIREGRLEEKFEELVQRGITSGADQDLINIACFGRIKTLPFKYNVMTKYDVCDDESYEKNPSLPLCYTKAEWDEAVSNPVVIHYADKEKPWKNLAVDFADVWWKYFLDCVDDKSLIMEYISQAINQSKETKKAGKGLNELQAKINSLEEEISSIYRSHTFRIGNSIMRIPRKFKNLRK